MELFPGGRQVRIRTLQSHEQEVETSRPGTRTALNLAGVERREIERGALIAATGQARESTRFLADVRTIRSVDEELTTRGAYHLHAGSGSWPMRLRPLESKGILGVGAALLTLDEPLPLRCGDRFIIREVGRRAVVGGGRILDPAPVGRIGHLRSTSRALRIALDEGPDAVADALLEARQIETLAHLEIDTGGGTPSHALVVGDLALSEAAVRRIASGTVELVRAYQEENPLRSGMPKASVASALDVPAGALQAVVTNTPGLVDDGATLHTDDFASDLGPAEEQAWRQARSTLSEAGFAVPRSSQLGLGPELLHSLIRSGKVIRVADDLVYLPEQIDAIVAALTRFDEPFSVAEFRDALEITRRQAVPLLEWFDAEGRTVRRGDVRSLRKPPGQARSDAPPR